jgi:uncharacterized protein
MGPTNVALVKYYQADQQLREAQARLDAVTRNVRVQERRVNDLAEKQKLAQTRLRETQSKCAQLELDLRSHDEHIEKLRTQQQNAKNNKEYQAFLIEINTQKLDKGKVEEEALRAMEAVEKGQTEAKELGGLLETEQAKLADMRQQIGDKIVELQGEIDQIKPSVDAAATAVPAKAREMYDRMAERFEGEALSAIAKPNPRREEYVCTACNMDLVTDVYNKLHSRDDLILCPSCSRILFIPEDLPVEVAVKKPKERKEPRRKNVGAAAARQQSAADVLKSIEIEEDDAPPDAPSPESSDSPDSSDFPDEQPNPGAANSANPAEQ